MAAKTPKPPTFDEWLAHLKQTKAEATLKGLTPSEQQTVYRGFVAKWGTDVSPGVGLVTTESYKSSEGYVGDITDRAISEYQNFKSDPQHAPLPAGIKPKSADAEATIRGTQASATEATVDANGKRKPTSASGQSALDRATAAALNNGQTFFPWMGAAVSGGVSQPFGGSQPSLASDQISAWRKKYNDENPDRQYRSNESFLQSSGAQEGRPEFKASFQRSLNVGDEEQVFFTTKDSTDPVNMHGFSGRTTKVGVSAGAVEAANSASAGGTPALRKYMEEIAVTAKQQGVPWQLLWGVLRARQSANPMKGKAGTWFGLDPSIVGPTGADPKKAIHYIASQLKQGYASTGDWALAALATDDPSTAANLRQTGKSTPGREARDGQYLMDVFGNTQNKQVSIYQLGFGANGENASTHPEFVVQQPGGTGDGGAGPTINVPDMDLLRNQAEPRIRQLLLRAPSQAEVDQMANGMRTSIIQAQSQTAAGKTQRNAFAELYDGQPTPNAVSNPTVNNDVDPQAGFYAQIQRSPEYQKLYSHRGGLTEQEYAQQFQGVQAELLGSEQNQEALRLGLESGSTDTMRGFLAGNSMNNRTFRQRLHETGQKVASVI